MVDTQILQFLTQLSVNNDKEWFATNKENYLKAKKSFDETTGQFITLIAGIDPSIGQPEVKDCTFRIYRDTRFSHNKEPYKTNMGCYVTRGGKKSPFAGYYLHLEPEKSFAAGGVYMPESNILSAVRTEILNFIDEFKTIIENSTFKNTFGEIDGAKLKSAPKGFDKNLEFIELLKFKSYTVAHHLSDQELTSSDLPNKLNSIFSAMKPFNQFINRAIEEIL